MADEQLNRPSRWSFLSSGWLLSIVAYLLTLPVAFLVVRALHLPPNRVRGVTMPVILGAVAFAAILVATRRWWRNERFVDAFAGVAAGLYAGWLALIAKAALYGTPHGFGGLEGDTKRIVAMATTYTTTWASADTFTKDMPAEYPPLFPWSIGRVSVLTGIEPWRLMATAQVVTLSGAVLIAFLMWRRLVSGPTAVALAIVSMAPFAIASKAYEIAVLVVLVPWILLTFAKPSRGRLHWLVAGLIGGLIFLTYQGFFVFVLPGVLAIIWRTWRASEERKGYLLHLAGVAGTALVISSWYLIPYVHAVLTRPSYFIADTYGAPVLGEDPLPLPFLNFTLVGLTCLIGLIGLIWANLRAADDKPWWAFPMAALVGGIYVFIAVASLRWALTGHNMFVHYATRILGVVLVTSAVLTLAEAWRRLPERGWTPVVRTTAVLLSFALAGAFTLQTWREWSATTIGLPGRLTLDLSRPLNPADLALVEPLPGGKLPKYAPTEAAGYWLPINQLRQEVESRLGAGARPVVVTVDERIFAYEPWHCYVNPWSTSAPTLSDWKTRHGAVRDLIKVTDPAAFAAAADAAPYGGIDVFVLRSNDKEPGKLYWLGAGMVFERTQFASPWFDVVELPNNYVVAIRQR